MKSDSIKELTKALVKVQAEVQGAIKDSSNPFFKSKYANLESCWDALRLPLSNNGLAVTQTMGFIQGAGPTLVTTLLHESGEWISGEQPMFPKTNSPQDLGSAISYSRRYGLAAITGLIQIDDDGETAEGRGDVAKAKTQAKTEKLANALPANVAKALPKEEDPADFMKTTSTGMPQLGEHVKKIVEGIKKKITEAKTADELKFAWAEFLAALKNKTIPVHEWNPDAAKAFIDEMTRFKDLKKVEIGG